MSDSNRDPTRLATFRANRIVQAGEILNLTQENIGYKAGCTFVTISRAIKGGIFKEKYVVSFAKATNTHIGIYSDESLSDEGFEQEVRDGILKGKTITSKLRIQPYEIERWKSFLEKYTDSDKIQIIKNERPEDETLKGLVPTSSIPKHSTPQFKSKIDQVTLIIDCQKFWHVAVMIFSNSTGWSNIPSEYQNKSINFKNDRPPVTIPNPLKELEPLTVTESGLQWIVAVTSIERLPVTITENLVDSMDVEYGVSDLFVHIDGMDEKKVRVLVKRFEVIK
jgi:hypothetical protein